MKRASSRAACAGVVACAAWAGALDDARAGGLYIADRGVRPLGRAGAFIAGADDLGAIAYNPAGLFDAGAQIMLDASWVNFSSEYTRQAIVTQLDPNTGQPVGQYEQTFPTVEGSTPFLPIPTAAFSFQPHKQWVLAAGVWGPYAAISSYPEEIEGQPAPQRYALLNLDGSALAVAGISAAFAPIKELRLGASFDMLVGTFRSLVVFSACVPDRFLCAVEQPDWDATAEATVGPIIAPSGKLGAIWAFNPRWRVGAAFALPFYVRAPATIRARLPATPLFERASQEGEDADVGFDLPWTLKVGVESRLVDDLRVELGFAYEAWSMHDAITVEPDGINLKNIAGFPENYYVPDVDVTRNFQDAVSFRLGGEYTFRAGDVAIDVRGGVAYETSAVPAESLTVLTIDSAKVTPSLGASVHIGKVRIDAVFAHVFASEVVVDPAEANVASVMPVRANPPERPHYINGGVYSSRTNIVGLGISYLFDPAPPDMVPAPQ